MTPSELFNNIAKNIIDGKLSLIDIQKEYSIEKELQDKQCENMQKLYDQYRDLQQIHESQCNKVDIFKELINVAKVIPLKGKYFKIKTPDFDHCYIYIKDIKATYDDYISFIGDYLYYQKDEFKLYAITYFKNVDSYFSFGNNTGDYIERYFNINTFEEISEQEFNNIVSNTLNDTEIYQR